MISRPPPHFRWDDGLVGSKVGVLRDGHGMTYVDLSPDMYSLWQTDKCAFLDSLKVRMPDGKERVFMDLGSDL